MSNINNGALDTQALGLVPMVVETSGRGERAYDIYSDRKSTRLNSSHSQQSRMPSSA